MRSLELQNTDEIATMKNCALYISLLFLFACDYPVNKESRETKEKQVIQHVENISFTFPAGGFAYENRHQLIRECLDAIKSNSSIIKLPRYSDSITVHFLRSREEMKSYTGMTPSGIALVEQKKLYIVANGDSNEVKPPVKHELMHMMAMTTWGYPAQDSNWMNEGLAAYAENNCNGFNDGQIYRYLLEKNMLITMTTLATNFYKEQEMIAYHQAAYVVQHLLENYGVVKFKELWIQGFPQFEQIYGLNFQQVKINIDKKVKRDYPVVPAIDWSSFKKGCLLGNGSKL